ncbi:unnamed protein product [Mycetohabitans rhizoxinica HKI 454]|uniref:Uncharacterized protein n=1 Tax=Mycetohabitans rhizoxinica (strain DSM 19002 / CIP 109453 / HKI 454) TaxID=882378 RepID=E5AMS1_MYCRK|nr:unnamed protein product [Mycetohabitans rhizoxinica HKI 454]
MADPLTPRSGGPLQLVSARKLFLNPCFAFLHGTRRAFYVTCAACNRQAPANRPQPSDPVRPSRPCQQRRRRLLQQRYPAVRCRRPLTWYRRCIWSQWRYRRRMNWHQSPCPHRSACAESATRHAAPA